MKLVQELKAILQYHKEIGLDSYPLTDSIRKFLSIPPSDQVHGRKEPSIMPGQRPQTASPISGAENISQDSEPLVSLADIADEVQSCRACELHRRRIYPVAGRGTESARLLIVGDWLSGGRGNDLIEGRIFGVEQDQMLARMLAAINLPQDAVFITNVVKCGVPSDCQPHAVHVKSCISYLRRQIVAIRPEVICTMGMVVSRALLEKSQPLSRLRGRFHQYHLDKQVSIPVLTTYHPTYLLQNPEMKRATWDDLQLLGRRLGLRFKQ